MRGLGASGVTSHVATTGKHEAGGLYSSSADLGGSPEDCRAGNTHPSKYATATKKLRFRTPRLTVSCGIPTSLSKPNDSQKKTPS